MSRIGIMNSPVELCSDILGPSLCLAWQFGHSPQRALHDTQCGRSSLPVPRGTRLFTTFTAHIHTSALEKACSNCQAFNKLLKKDMYRILTIFQ